MVDGKVFEILERLSEREIEYQAADGAAYAYLLREDLTPDEIEIARDADGVYFDCEGYHLVANFLPDDERPTDVPALAKRNAENVGKPSKERTVFSAFWHFLRGANRRTV